MVLPLIGLVAALSTGCGDAPGAGGVEGDADADADADTDATCESEIDVPTYAEAHRGDPTLRTAEGCDEIADLLRQKLLEQMVATVEQSRDHFLQIRATPDSECWDYSDTDTDADTDADSDADGDTGGASDYSTTNNQVEGVDEPDFVKNDGNYLYLLADGRFQIFDAWPAEEAHRLSATAIEGEPKKMFVLGDRAVVYSSLPAVWTGDDAYDEAGYYGGECTYGYDCEMMGDGRPLKITVLDISDLAAPTVVREIDLSGSLLAGRSIDGTTFTMVVFPQMGAGASFGGSYVPEELNDYWYACGSEIPYTSCEIQQMFDALIEENTALIGALDPEVILPNATDRKLVDGAWEESSELFSDCSSFYLANSGDGMNQMSLLTFDPAENGDLAIASIIDRPGAVYANAESLYVASRHTAVYGDEWYFEDPYATPEATTVHKFALDPAAMTAEYRGSGAVKGRVLNQFSMDEDDAGYLRIATSTGHLPDTSTHSTVSVLQETDGALATVGQIDGIAPSEDIRSVRFDGEKGYVVTFEKTDPLFVLDLADPTAPEIVGELVIPGFSTYIHLMDERHLLTIGYDADDMGDFSWFQGVRLQIFDIADPANPVLDHYTVIGTRGSTSEATTNHLAFNYFASRGLLAIPMTICEGGDEGEYGYDMTFSGLLVYSVTADGGFTQLGGVPHAAATSGDDYDSVCGNWWTAGNSAVKRSVFMEDYVFSIAPELVNVANVSSLSDVLVSLDLTAE